MGIASEQQAVLAAKFETILAHLDERWRRLLLGAEARSIGHGGIRLVARAAGVREATVSLGVRELESGEPPLGRVRRPQPAQAPAVPARHPRRLHSRHRPDPRRSSVTLTSRSQ